MTAKQLLTKLEEQFSSHKHVSYHPQRKTVPQCQCKMDQLGASEPRPQINGKIVTQCPDCRMPIIPCWFNWNEPVGQGDDRGDYYVLYYPGKYNHDGQSAHKHSIARGDLTSGLEIIYEGDTDDEGKTFDELLEIIVNAKFATFSEICLK